MFFPESELESQTHGNMSQNGFQLVTIESDFYIHHQVDKLFYTNR